MESRSLSTSLPNFIEICLIVLCMENPKVGRFNEVRDNQSTFKLSNFLSTILKNLKKWENGVNVPVDVFTKFHFNISDSFP